MIHKLVSGNTGGGTWHISGRDVSHLLFVCPHADVAKGMLTVILEQSGPGGDGKTEVLVNRIPFAAIEGISDVKEGSSLGLRALLAAMNAQIVVGGGAATAMQEESAFVLDLGNIVLTGPDRLEVAVDVSSAMSGLAVYCLDLVAGQERIFRYEISSDVSRAVADPVELWVYRTSEGTGSEMLTDDVSIDVVLAEGNSWLADMRGYWAVTAALGQVEAQAPTRVAKIYSDKWGFPLHGNLAYNATGKDVENYSFISVKEVMDENRGSKKTIEVAQRLQRRVSALETSKPREAKLLRHRNLIPKAAHLAAAIAPVVKAQAMSERVSISPVGNAGAKSD